MILQSLRLHNWRQFCGTTPEIRFSGPGERPITIFFGANGSGKTALLNAFTWTLYGSTTRGFLFPDQIVNKAAIRDAEAGSEVDGWAQLKFEHLGNQFIIKKSVRVHRQPDGSSTPLGDPTIEMQHCGPDGKWKSTNDIAETIGRILPLDLHTYFFFDGERIERIVRPDQKERADIGNATKMLFGLEVLERAIRHFNAARKILEKESASIGDAETKQLLGEKQVKELEIERHMQRSDELDRNIVGNKDLKTEVEERLRQLNEVRATQERRDFLNGEHDRRKASLTQISGEMAHLISDRGHTVYVAEACRIYWEVIEEKRSRGELPSGIKRQFVDDLLEAAKCICNRGLDLKQNREARTAVTDWRHKAGLGDVEEKAIRMGGEVKQLELHISEFWRMLDQYAQKRFADREHLAKIQTELETISAKLRNSPKEEVSQLEKRLSRIENSIESDNQEKGSIAALVNQLSERLTEIDVELERHKAKETRQQIAQMRVSAAQEAVHRLEEARSRFEVAIRQTLVKKVRGLFDIISYTPYVPELADDYSLLLKESAGGAPLPVAASQGESQILSLCFIGAIIAITKEYQAKKEHLLGSAETVYPIVMDSPFGSLGPVYRTQITEHVTRLADQVILMVTSTQWRGEVEQSLKGRVGHRYLLEYFSPKKDLPRETIDIDNGTHDLVRESPSEYEYTQVIEVSNG